MRHSCQSQRQAADRANARRPALPSRHWYRARLRPSSRPCSPAPSSAPPSGAARFDHRRITPDWPSDDGTGVPPTLPRGCGAPSPPRRSAAPRPRPVPPGPSPSPPALRVARFLHPGAQLGAAHRPAGHALPPGHLRAPQDVAGSRIPPGPKTPPGPGVDAAADSVRFLAMPLVLATAEGKERSGYLYDDRTGVSYEYPNRYAKLVQTG